MILLLTAPSCVYIVLGRIASEWTEQLVLEIMFRVIAVIRSLTQPLLASPVPTSIVSHSDGDKVVPLFAVLLISLIGCVLVLWHHCRTEHMSRRWD